MHTTARHPRPRPRPRLRAPLRAALAAAAAFALALPPAGCKTEVAKENIELKKRYSELDPKTDVPPHMKGTVWEVVTRTNDVPLATAGYALVGRLRGTGDSTASLQVRQWMNKQMVRHGYGSNLLPGYKDVGAEQILRDPSFAIVRVDAMIPPGAREGDFFDVTVKALPGNRTSNLSGGIVFETDLARPRNGAPDLSAVTVLAKAKGPVLVNPAYALEGAAGPAVTATAAAGAAPAAAPPGVALGAQAKASLRAGVVMGGGRVMRDRPLHLRLLHPSLATSRFIERRINQRFQAIADRRRTDVMPAMFQVAFAYDEGVVEVYVPAAYGGDWRHFISVVEHLYLNGSPAEQIARAKSLVQQADAPGAGDSPERLASIGYALEGIGDPALQYVLPMMAHRDPNVAYVMARSAAFIGDGSGAAQESLLRMARNDAHPFQLDAIRTLGAMPNSPDRNQKIRDVLESRNTLARVEAYKVLVRNGDGGVFTRWVSDPRDRRPEGERLEKFALDIVEAGGEPIVFASRSGIARIALIGPRPKLVPPVLFTAMDGRLMIASGTGGANVTIFYRDKRLRDEGSGGDRFGRDEDVRDPVQMPSRPDLGEIVARLGGEGAPEEERFDFTYGEIVAVLQTMAQQRMIGATRDDGRLTRAPFIFEQPRDSQDLIDSAPVIEQTRPNTGGEAKAGGGRMKDEG